eukprot:5215416-Prymnesium_polylepis.1
MEMTAHDKQPTSEAQRVAAAAEPHKRRAVAAETAVETVGNGGKSADGAWGGRSPPLLGVNDVTA